MDRFIHISVNGYALFRDPMQSHTAVSHQVSWVCPACDSFCVFVVYILGTSCGLLEWTQSPGMALPVLQVSGAKCVPCHCRMHFTSLWTRGPSSMLPWAHASIIPSTGITLVRELSGPRATHAQRLVHVGHAKAHPACLSLGPLCRPFQPRALSGAIGALAATASQLKTPCDLPSSPVFTTDVSRPNPQETPSTQILCF